MTELPTHVELNGVMVRYDQISMIYERVLQFVEMNIDKHPDMKTVQIPYVNRDGVVPIIFTVEELLGKENHEDPSG